MYTHLSVTHTHTHTHTSLLFFSLIHIKYIGMYERKTLNTPNNFKPFLVSSDILLWLTLTGFYVHVIPLFENLFFHT